MNGEACKLGFERSLVVGRLLISDGQADRDVAQYPQLSNFGSITRGKTEDVRRPVDASVAAVKPAYLVGICNTDGYLGWRLVFRIQHCLQGSMHRRRTRPALRGVREQNPMLHSRSPFVVSALDRV